MISSSFFAPKDEKFFKQALLCDIVRGKDSTGIFTIDKHVDNELRSCKKAYPSYDFLQMDRPEFMMSRGNQCQVMVGHNRAATKGAISHNNAHPFTFGDITLVHNGTLTDYSKLEGYYNGASDSRLLTRAIAEHGIQAAVDAVSGAYALVWYDASDNSMNFLRNTQREFAVTQTANKREIYFASEPGMLDWLLDRNHIVAADAEHTAVDQHYKIELDSVGGFKPLVKEVKKHFMFQVVKPGSKQKPKQEGSKENQRKDALVARTALEKGKAHALAEMEKEGVTIPKPGDEIDGYFYSSERYNKQKDRGFIKGNMCDNPYLDIEIHNQDLTKFEEGEYLFKIATVAWMSDRKDFLIRGNAQGLGKKILPKILTKGTVVSSKEVQPQKREVLSLPNPATVTILEEKGSMTSIVTQPSTSKPLITKMTSSPSNDRGLLRQSKDPIRSGKTNLGSILGRAYERERPLNIIKPKTIDLSESDSSNKFSGFDYFGYDGHKCSKEVFDELTKYGCAVCTGNLFGSDSKNIEWKDQHTPVCESCQDEERHMCDQREHQAVLAMEADGCPPFPEGHKLH